MEWNESFNLPTSQIKTSEAEFEAVDVWLFEEFTKFVEFVEFGAFSATYCISDG
jgi:hypothetical protein